MTTINRKPHSKLQAWLWKEEEIPSVLSMENRIFHLLLKTTAAFDKPRGTSRISFLFQNFQKRYDRDDQLFEVCSFLLYGLDQWHDQFGLSAAKKEIIPFLRHQSERFFSKFLRIQNIEEILRNRLMIYGDLAQDSEMKARLILVQFLKRSTHRPQLIKADLLEPLIVASAHPLYSKVINFQEDHLPQFLKQVEKIYHVLGLMER